MKNKAALLTLLLALCVHLGYAQSRTVSGVIKSADGQTLPGVAVIEKGTSNGVSSDFDGKFTITLTTENPVLVFQAIGMADKEVAVGSESFINVQMKESTEELDEVVITALGISKDKKALGYSVSEIGGDEVAQSGENNIIQSLSAKAPGIQVMGSGGTPGSSSKILLRGNATFTGQNQPLIVVDGVPIDNSTTQSSPRDYPFNANLQGVNNSNRAIDINPDDIESVTVLKGPAAAALYGARAGNGVIMYTTKRGKAGKKGLGVTVSQKVTLNQVNKLPELQDKYAQGVGGGTPAGDDSATYVTNNPGADGVNFTDDAGESDGTPNSWGPSISSLGIEKYDNPGNFFKLGVSTNTNVSVVGGDEKTGVRLSMGYLNDQGMIPNTSLERITVRLTADTRLSDKIKVGGTVNYTNSNSVMAQNGSNTSGVMLSLLRAPATFDLENYKLENGDNNNYFAAYDNPYYTVNENPFTSNLNRVLGNVFVNYQATDWLSFSYKIGADAYTDQRKQIYAISSQNADNPGAGQVNINTINNANFYGDLIATVNTNLSEKWTFDFNLGHNFYTSSTTDIFSRGRNLAVRDFYNLANTSDLYSSEFVTEILTQAIFGQAEFAWDNTWFISFTGRNEWSSTFEQQNNSFFYPSISTSLVFTEFLDNRPDWFDFGKVRYSYANTGISPIPYSTRPLYTTPFYTDGFTNGLTFPYTGVNSFAISGTYFTPDLKPERLHGHEVGLNLIFLKRRVDFDITYYHQKTVDALLYQPLANSSGFQQFYVNGGSILNQGFEVALGFVPITNDNFTWRVDLNWSRNRSEVLSLVPDVDQFSIEEAFTSIGSFAIVGEPYGVFYGTVWERSDDGEDILIDEDGFPILSRETKGVGDPNPDWLGGIRNTFSYKGFQFSFFFDIRKGGDVWNGTYARLNQIGNSKESAENREGTRTVEGVYAPGTIINGQDVSGQKNKTPISAIDYYRFVVGDAGGASEEFVEEVNWVRLRDVNLSYRFMFDKEASVKYLDVAINCRNLLLFTNYKGVDPETSLTGAGSNIGGLDYFNNPGSRSYTLGLSFGL